MARLLYRIRFLLGVLIVILLGYIIALIFGRTYTFTSLVLQQYKTDISDVVPVVEEGSPDCIEITDYGIDKKGKYFICIYIYIQCDIIHSLKSRPVHRIINS